MFWERFYNLCKEAGKKPNPVAAELGFGSSTVTHWKNGTTPNGAALKKIADYFNVPMSYLLGDDATEVDPATKRLLELFAKVPQDKKEALIQLIESTLKMQGLI